jgi:hypothetical protein
MGEVIISSDLQENRLVSYQRKTFWVYSTRPCQGVYEKDKLQRDRSCGQKADLEKLEEGKAKQQWKIR